MFVVYSLRDERISWNIRTYTVKRRRKRDYTETYPEIPECVYAFGSLRSRDAFKNGVSLQLTFERPFKAPS